MSASAQFKTRKTIRPSQSRRGSVYAAVLATSLIVTVIGMTALTGARLQFANASDQQDVAQARLLGEQGVGLALQHLDEYTNWRTGYTNGSWYVGHSTEINTYQIRLVDPTDGDLADDPSDPVRISVRADIDNVTRIVSATAHIVTVNNLGDDLIDNGGFESGTSDWTGSPFSWNADLDAINNGTAYVGDQYLRVSGRDGNTSGARQTLTTADVIEGESYLLKFVARQSAAQIDNVIVDTLLWSGFSSKAAKWTFAMNSADADQWVAHQEIITFDWPGASTSSATLYIRTESDDQNYHIDQISLNKIIPVTRWTIDPTSWSRETLP